ncbi:MAG TPA: Fe-S oxidoreductase, partial [Gammaproteobacteria bacterium]|nr:Fe-S oxidoreductase [Gammaproteobacteria bacterium]
MSKTTSQEGSLQAPTRYPVAWQSEDFYNESSLYTELERVYDICHGCRRCFNLCNAFPLLFDAIDESETMELDGVPRSVYWDVVDQCYLCDMCYLTKCPYVPPHQWNVDFPHLMLRAKAIKYRQGKTRLRDRMITSTDNLGKLAGIPIVVNVVNASNHSSLGRKLLQKVLGIHPDAHLPDYQRRKLRARVEDDSATTAIPAGRSQGKVALFGTCYGNYNEPQLGEDLAAVLRHNQVPMRLAAQTQCCGMPKMELGNLDAVARAKEANIPVLADWVDQGWDLMALVPSCVLMFKQELPLLFPDDALVRKVAKAMFDPFEYLALRHRHKLFNTEFKQSLGKVAYHVACHQRVQNIGPRTREILALIPDTEVTAIERCSGHDGTYAVKQECFEIAKKICRPVVSR